MTPSPLPADDQVREVLARALAAATERDGWEQLHPWDRDWYLSTIDALLPAVSALLTEARADAFDELQQYRCAPLDQNARGWNSALDLAASLAKRARRARNTEPKGTDR